MNFDQAKELSFLVPWKTAECFTGPDCWCRIILPVEPILYNHPESPDIEREYIIVDAGALDQETAEYFVDLHNSCLERIAQITPSNQELLNMIDKRNKIVSDAMKETMDSLIPLAHQSVTHTNNPTIDDFRKIKRKKID